MTAKSIINITRGPLIINDSGHTLGARETRTFDDSAVSNATLALIGRLISQGKLISLTDLPTTPDPGNPDPTIPTTPGGLQPIVDAVLLQLRANGATF